MAIQAFAESVICSRCGMKFPKRKGYFPINYSGYYKGTGSLHICKTCLEDIYNKYYAECENTELAVRQTCRALNLYWSKEELKRIASLMLLDKEAISLQFPNTEMCFE